MYWISDPGHAWLRVSLKKLFDLGLAEKISNCSYVKNGFAYLEEDQDACIFLEAINKNPNDYRDINTNNYSRIRNYYNYSLHHAIVLYNHFYY